jgi:molybdopterin-containing oxidoreductase family iron-sulfur binding subunit
MTRSPDGAANDSLDRRDFLKLAGAGLALAGLDGCSRMPAEHILPYVDNRPELTPGTGQYYATAMMVDGYATGLIVESHEGRPTKIEGNPQHPASLGASAAIHQASVLQLYDPDRAQQTRVGSSRAAWATVAAMLAPSTLRSRVGAHGDGLRLLIAPTSSPVEEELLTQLLVAYPNARVHMYAPHTATFETPLVAHCDLNAADVILAIDSDFLASGPFHLRYARQFADHRRLTSPMDTMNRLYSIESTVTPTGTAADHRFAVRPRDLTAIVQALHDHVAGNGSTAVAPAWLGVVASDLVEHRGRSLVIAGDRLPASLRSMIDAINAAIGASGRATWYAPSPLIGRRLPIHPFDDLVAALGARSVDTLIVVGANPSYATPASMNFSDLLRAVPNSGYLGLYENETARDVRWFVPMSHYLESWGDARAYDGTVSIVQPLINPLYESLTPAELYAVLAGAADGPGRGYDLLRASWAKRATGDAESAWSDALQRGVVLGTDVPDRLPAPTVRSTPADASANAAKPADGTLDVIYVVDPKVHDGSFANNGWLQELPAPITQMTWGNAALVSPRTAKRIAVSTGDTMTLTSGSARIAVPVYVLPGQADDTATVSFGYGRTGGESVARGVGINAFALWPAVGTTVQSGVRASPGGHAPPFALAQTEGEVTVGQPVRQASLEQYRRSPTSVGDRPGRVLSLYPEPVVPGNESAPKQWAMTIDLGTCIGCAACVVACQAENNIPVVGADQVSNHRQMHWLRIDRYFVEGPADDASTAVLLQPMLCQHCERAPCEYVCPVEATVHSSDGLNEMVYNRCVGTRFCSNNCPYKVRRFNWFDYNAHLSPTELMVKNPNVTVRERGVMEKCTFCVQRIREAEIAAQRDGRALGVSDVQTACQQACPTNAIVFGSLTDTDSEMMRRRQQPRAYAALRDLGTEPRVRYLARIRNENPALGTKA